MRALVLALLATPALAQEPGDFDYWVLALSWSPTWCALEGDGDDAQCQRRMGWLLHGLWPQYEEGWPSYCRGEFRDPTRRETADMADLQGSGGLAWHAWDKHGTCSGLAPQDYFALSREAFEAVTLPDLADQWGTTSAAAVERALLDANPVLAREEITVTCDDGHIEEVRLCLDLDMNPRRCGDDVIRDCRLGDAVLPAP